MATEKWIVGYNPITFESFIRHITKHREPYDQYDMGYTDAVDNIESWMTANTVDAVEVVHGRWVWRDGCFHCTNCKYTEDHITNYCPNCGAKMDGDGNG